MKPSGIPSVQDVAIGALLHDIGKLLQRSSSMRLTSDQMSRAGDVLPSFKGRHSHWHALWTDAFFDWVENEELPWPKDVKPGWVRDLAIYHHRPLQSYPHAPERIVTELVTVADQLASGYERRPHDVEEELDDRSRDSFRRIPMTAIMPSLSLESTRASRVAHHLPGELDADAIVPKPGREGGEIGNRTHLCYSETWKGFREGWRTLAVALGQDSDAHLFEEALMSLCERWLWAVPSSTIDEPDISLFDHSRAVSGFAAALYQYHSARNELTSADAIRDRMRPKFRFLVGDLSGLQTTLFRFRRERVRGLNRILRGRSLKFQLIADAGIRLVLKEFEMPWSAAFQTAGGRFLILLPELGDEEMRIRTNRLRTAFDHWLVREYTGDLGLGLALSRPFCVHDLVKHKDEVDDHARNERARKVRDDIAVAAESAKLQQFREPAETAVLNLDYPHGVCGACGVRPAQRAETDKPESYCVSCQSESELGRRFPKSHKILIGSGSADSMIFELGYALRGPGDVGSSGWRFGNEGRQAEIPAAFRPGHCHVPRLSEAEAVKFRELEDHDDIQAGDIKTFEVLAERSARNGTGRKMLAILAADVDRLGRLFREGAGSRWSLARAAALSRMVDGYFSIRLPRVLESEWPDIYTVYAGGDDLLLLGPWQDMFEFAARLREDFASFSLENDAVTLSAAIALFDVKSPVSIAAREARNRLAKVKSSGRNGISAIENRPMPWDTYCRAMENASKMNGLLQDGTLSTAALYRFLEMSDAVSRIAGQDARQEDHAWRARLGYTLARNLPDCSSDERQQAAFDFVISLFGLDRRLSGALDGATGVRLALSHAIYQNRWSNSAVSGNVKQSSSP